MTSSMRARGEFAENSFLCLGRTVIGRDGPGGNKEFWIGVKHGKSHPSNS